jgi:hypothetical protein
MPASVDSPDPRSIHDRGERRGPWHCRATYVTMVGLELRWLKASPPKSGQTKVATICALLRDLSPI